MAPFRDTKRASRRLARTAALVFNASMKSAFVPSIDCHAHIYTREMLLAPDAWHRPEGEAGLAQLSEQLQAAGVARCVLAAASIYGDNNDYALAACAADQRLRTTVIVRPGTGVEALRVMREAGAVGIRLQLRNKPLPDLRSTGFRGLLRAAADLGWHVELHDDLHRLPPLIRELECQGMPVVVDHFGRPSTMDDLTGDDFGALLAAVDRGRCWIKISAGFRLASAALARAASDRLLTSCGTARLLWGSDWPFAAFEGRVDYSQALADFAQQVPVALQRAEMDRTGNAFYFS